MNTTTVLFQNVFIHLTHTWGWLAHRPVSPLQVYPRTFRSLKKPPRMCPKEGMCLFIYDCHSLIKMSVEPSFSCMEWACFLGLAVTSAFLPTQEGDGNRRGCLMCCDPEPRGDKDGWGKQGEHPAQRPWSSAPAHSLLWAFSKIVPFIDLWSILE